MTTETSIPAYDRFIGLCSEVAKRYPSIFSLPVAEEPYPYICRVYAERYRGRSVLEFGAGALKPLQRALAISDDLYSSCDTDASGVFTFRDVHAVPEGNRYAVVVANQVLEHLTFEQGMDAAVALSSHLEDDGIILLSAPNPQHPTRWLSNPTHKTPWGYLNLCALLMLGGIEPVFCARSNKVPGPATRDEELIDTICRVFRMDWCDTVYVVGAKRNTVERA
jgi:hypothetical protein